MLFNSLCEIFEKMKMNSSTVRRNENRPDEKSVTVENVKNTLTTVPVISIGLIKTRR